MSISLDGQVMFDEHQLNIEKESVHRDSLERSAIGLDGVISIDLGQRKRTIKQRGVIRSNSTEGLNETIENISSLIDGNTHTLTLGDGTTISNLRMDTFKVSKEQASGNGISCDYEIVYTQLVV